METIKKYGCTGSHGGAEKKCDSCANNIKNYPETEEGQKQWQESEKIDDLVCRLPQGENGEYWTQYIPLNLHS